jgi:hypothetical protein
MAARQCAGYFKTKLSIRNTDPLPELEAGLCIDTASEP